MTPPAARDEIVDLLLLAGHVVHDAFTPAPETHSSDVTIILESRFCDGAAELVAAMHPVQMVEPVAGGTILRIWLAP